MIHIDSVFFRTLPVDAPSHWAPEAQRAGPDRGGLVSGPQLRLDPLPRPSQPGELQQRAGILSEQTGQRAVCQRAGASTQRCTNTQNTVEPRGKHTNGAAVNKRTRNQVSCKNVQALQAHRDGHGSFSSSIWTQMNRKAKVDSYAFLFNGIREVDNPALGCCCSSEPPHR